MSISLNEKNGKCIFTYLLYATFMFAFFSNRSVALAQQTNCKWSDDRTLQNEEQNQPSLTDVHFVDVQKGWIINTDGGIYQTVNGGLNWGYKLLTPKRKLNSLHFVDAQNGWLVGDSATLLRTTNGGQNWTVIPVTGVDNTQPFNSVYFINAQRGWLINAQSVWTSADGGATWTPQQKPSIFDSRLKEIYFINAQNGWMVGEDGVLLQTKNGGNTWTKNSFNADYTDLKGVHFVDTLNGWIIGGSNGKIYHTVNGGQNWTTQNTDIFDDAFDITFVNAQEGWATYGGFGNIAHTTDGGNEWKKVNPPTISGLLAVYFIDAQNGWAVGGSREALFYSCTSARETDFVQPQNRLIVYANADQTLLTVAVENIHSTNLQTLFRQFKIYDAQGRLCAEAEAAYRRQATLDIASLAPGIYVLQADGIDYQQTVRFLKH